MNLEGLQIFSHEVSGYKPQVDFNTWRVALPNASDMYLPNNITYFDNHLETDEVFILLSGSCALLLAGNDEKPHDTVCHWLEEGKVYNVKSGTWHTLFMMPGSKLAVIENRDTSVANSPRYYFSDEERANLIPEINSI